MSALALALLLAAAKPQVDLKPNPSLAIIPPGTRGTTVHFRLSVKDGGSEDYYCPRIEWEWEDGTTSSEEADCPPFEQAQKTDHERVFTKAHQFWEPGQQRVSVRLYKGDRMVRKVDATVEIRGEGVPTRFREREP